MSNDFKEQAVAASQHWQGAIKDGTAEIVSIIDLALAGASRVELVSPDAVREIAHHLEGGLTPAGVTKDQEKLVMAL